MMKKYCARFMANVVILVVLVGCDVPSNRNASQNNMDRKIELPPSTAIENGPSKPIGPLTAKVFGLPEPNHYQVNLSWSPLAPAPGEWVLQRENAHTGLRHLKTLEPTALSYEDATVAAGESYRYFLASGEAIETDIREKTSVIIPLDLAISGRAAYQQINAIERLFLPAGAVLFPKGDQLFIEVKTIIASGGQIESNGRAITIKAQRATGNLKIRNQGQDGMPGAAGGQGSNGSPGSTGAPAQIVYSGPRYPPLDYQMLVKHMTTSLQNDPQNPEFKSHFKCQSPPGPGGNGGPGTAGAPGQDGGAGGDSGRLYLAILSTSGFELDHLSVAGRGGDGGAGGMGGAGGLGGRAGARDASQICPEAHPGQNGPTGAKAMNGKTGPDGHLQPYCLKLGDGAMGNCAAFTPSDFINGGTIR